MNHPSDSGIKALDKEESHSEWDSEGICDYSQKKKGEREWKSKEDGEKMSQKSDKSLQWVKGQWSKLEMKYEYMYFRRWGLSWKLKFLAFQQYEPLPPPSFVTLPLKASWIFPAGIS